MKAKQKGTQKNLTERNPRGDPTEPSRYKPSYSLLFPLPFTLANTQEFLNKIPNKNHQRNPPKIRQPHSFNTSLSSLSQNTTRLSTKLQLRTQEEAPTCPTSSAQPDRYHYVDLASRATPPGLYNQDRTENSATPTTVSRKNLSSRDLQINSIIKICPESSQPAQHLCF